MLSETYSFFNIKFNLTLCYFVSDKMNDIFDENLD